MYQIMLSQASKDLYEPLVPMAFPALSAHVSDAKFMYCDNKYYELCGQMGYLIGPSGIGKAQLTHLIEAIMRLFRDHDKVEYERLADLADDDISNLCCQFPISADYDGLGARGTKIEFAL